MRTLKDEDPGPAVLTADAGHLSRSAQSAVSTNLANAVCEQAAEGTGERRAYQAQRVVGKKRGRAREKDADSQVLLLTRVLRGERALGLRSDGPRS